MPKEFSTRSFLESVFQTCLYVCVCVCICTLSIVYCMFVFLACLNVCTGVCIIKVVMPSCRWGGFVGADPRGGLSVQLTEILRTTENSYRLCLILLTCQDVLPCACLILLDFTKLFSFFSKQEHMFIFDYLYVALFRTLHKNGSE